MKRIKLITESEKKNIPYSGMQQDLKVVPETKDFIIGYHSVGDTIKIPKKICWCRITYPMTVKLVYPTSITCFSGVKYVSFLGSTSLSCNVIPNGERVVTLSPGLYCFLTQKGENIPVDTEFKVVNPKTSKYFMTLSPINSVFFSKYSFEAAVESNYKYFFLNSKESLVLGMMREQKYYLVFKLNNDNKTVYRGTTKNFKILYDYFKHFPDSLVEILFIPYSNSDAVETKPFTLKNIEKW